MVWDQIMGKWSQVKGKAKKTWGRFTDNDLEVIQGKRDQLLGKLREVYGVAKDEAELQVKRFEKAAGATFKAVARAAGLGKPAQKRKAARRSPKRPGRPVIAKSPKRKRRAKR